MKFQKTNSMMTDLLKAVDVEEAVKGGRRGGLTGLLKGMITIMRMKIGLPKGTEVEVIVRGRRLGTIVRGPLLQGYIRGSN